MASMFSRLVRSIFPASKRTQRNRRPNLAFDLLESRDVMTATITPGLLAPPSASDLFDSTKTSVVSGTSTYNSEYSLAKLIDGASMPSPESNNTIFADGPGQGFTDVAVLRTASPVLLNEFRLFLAQDGVASTNRSADAVRFYASSDGVNFQLISQAGGLSNGGTDSNGNTGYAYGATESAVTISEVFATAVAGQFFKVEIDRHGSMGPRVLELDGFGMLDTSTPPPGAATVTPGFIAVASNDLFDLSQGAAVVGSSTYNNDFGIREMLDGAAGVSETDHTIFADGQAAGSTSHAVVRTATPVQLSSFNLVLGQDGLSNSNRSAAAVRLYASADGISYTLISQATNLTANQAAGYGYRFNSNVITISENFATPVSGQFFKLEVDRHGTNGVRVMEFDGFGTGGIGANRLKETVFNSNVNVIANGDEAPGLVNAITSSSAYPGFNAADAFGRLSSQYEPGHFIFADGASGDSLSWTTTQAVTLTGYRVGLFADGDTTFRSSGRVRFYAGIGSASTLVDEFENASMSGILSRLLASEVTGDHFRFEIDRTGAGGPRVTEIDAIVGNHAPVVLNDSATANVGSPISIQVLANDYDPDGDALTIVTNTLPQNGTVQLVGSGSAAYFQYERFSNTAATSDWFTYTISDGQGGATTATVSLTLPNFAPVAADDWQTSSGLATTIYVLKNDFDPDGDTLSIQSWTSPASGTVYQDNGSLVYTPTGALSEADSFTYTITDGRGHTSTATVTIDFLNSAPIAPAPRYLGVKGETLSVDRAMGVLADASDENGDTLTAHLYLQASYGTVVLSPDGSFEYIPNSDDVEEDQFEFRPFDGLFFGLPAQVTITLAQNRLVLNPGDPNSFTIAGTANYGRVEAGVQVNRAVRRARADLLFTLPFQDPFVIARQFTSDQGAYSFTVRSGLLPQGSLSVRLTTASDDASEDQNGLRRAMSVGHANLRVGPVAVMGTTRWVVGAGLSTFSVTTFVPGNNNQNVAVATQIGQTTSAEKAFWVFDAAITAAKAMSAFPLTPLGRTSMPLHDIPNVASMAPPGLSGPLINIAEFDDFDTVIHEIGHNFQQINGFFPFTAIGYVRHAAGDPNGAPAEHSWNSNLRDQHPNPTTSMSRIRELAFSEGFAYFFSVFAQFIDQSVPSAALGNAVTSSNGRNNVSGDLFIGTEPVESPFNFNNFGEDHEVTTMRLLWDLFDAANPQEPTDAIQQSFTTIVILHAAKNDVFTGQLDHVLLILSRTEAIFR